MIKKCSSFVPQSGQIDQDSLNKIKKCLSDNNGYMPKEYQFTPQQTKPVNEQQATTTQSQAVPQQQVQDTNSTPTVTQQKPTSAPQQDSSQQNLGPSYLR